MDHEGLRAEHQICHAKMSLAVEQLHRIEQYALVGIGAVYAWYGTSTNSNSEDGAVLGTAASIVLWIPVAFALLALVRGAMQRSYMASLATYITLVETKLFSDSGIVGWETWFKRNQNTILNWLFRILLWPGLLAFTTYVALHPSVFLANSAR